MGAAACGWDGVGVGGGVGDEARCSETENILQSWQKSQIVTTKCAVGVERDARHPKRPPYETGIMKIELESLGRKWENADALRDKEWEVRDASYTYDLPADGIERIMTRTPYMDPIATDLSHTPMSLTHKSPKIFQNAGTKSKITSRQHSPPPRTFTARTSKCKLPSTNYLPLPPTSTTGNEPPTY